MRKTTLFILFVVGLASCKKEVTVNVDQDKIFTHYQLSYDENSNTTTAKATFRFNNQDGTRLQLSEPSTVTADSQTMEWSEENGNYTKEFSGLVPTVLFQWVDLDGNSFSNTAEIRDIDYPVTLPDYSYADSVNYFQWEGAALDSFESASITFYGTNQARVFAVDSIAATTITIDSVRLSQVDSGEVLLVLKKLYSPDLVEGTSKGGLIQGSYQPTNRTFILN
ncbi:MAG: hypothetical protein H6603_06340 [Flavobacteriales bacterium]|nr:hypothetical protein [Flavobacteriales bacterium]MCB9204581.1 hypothetical protein [Flavobacteriales bacterium]